MILTVVGKYWEYRFSWEEHCWNIPELRVCMYLCSVQCSVVRTSAAAADTFTVLSTIMEETATQAVALYNQHQLSQLASRLQWCSCSVSKVALPLLAYAPRDFTSLCSAHMPKILKPLKTLRFSTCKTKTAITLLLSLTPL